MRHFLASRAVAALALRVRQAPRKARLVARAGCPQRGRAGTLGAAGGAIALPPIAVAADQHCRAACSTEIASSGRLHGPWGRWETRRQRPLRERLRAQRPRRLARVWGATLGMTWRFEPVSRLRCHRPSPIVRASATRVPNALPPDCTNTPPAIGAPGSGAFPVALRAPSNAPDPIKQTAAIRSPDQGHAVPCRRWTPDLCGNRPPLTAASPTLCAMQCNVAFIDASWLNLSYDSYIRRRTVAWECFSFGCRRRGSALSMRLVRNSGTATLDLNGLRLDHWASNLASWTKVQRPGGPNASTSRTSSQSS